MPNLFEKGGLQQDTGSLSERWGQQGSNVVNISGGESADTTIYTVSINKKIYVKSIHISNLAASNTNFELRDDGVTGDVKFVTATNAVLGDSWSVVFETPLVFEVDIYLKFSVAGAIGLTITGWEEQG